MKVAGIVKQRKYYLTVGVARGKPPHTGTPAGLEINPHDLSVGACSLALTGEIPVRVHPGRRSPGWS